MKTKVIAVIILGITLYFVGSLVAVDKSSADLTISRCRLVAGPCDVELTPTQQQQVCQHCGHDSAACQAAHQAGPQQQ